MSGKVFRHYTHSFTKVVGQFINRELVYGKSVIDVLTSEETFMMARRCGKTRTLMQLLGIKDLHE